MKQYLLCNECHERTYNEDYFNRLECGSCGSGNVGIVEDKLKKRLKEFEENIKKKEYTRKDLGF